jgi:hypothetical protein
MKFQGDLMITDPAFVVKDEADWVACGYGDDMGALGFTTWCSALVTEGEEDLGAYHPDTGVCYGTFVTDSGVATAFLLEEILRYDPKFDEHLESPENVLWLRNFDGMVTVQGQGEDQWFAGQGTHPFRTR